MAALALGAGCGTLDRDLARAKDAASEKRVEAARALAAGIAGGDEDHLARAAEIGATLRALLDDPSALVRQAALDALAASEGRKAASLLQDRLRDRDPWVRTTAARVLGEVGAVESAEMLARAMLDDRSADVRRTAARSLAALKPPSAVYDLYLALSDGSAGVRYHAYLALREITGKDHGLDARAWRDAIPRQR